jgi:hypothetical protein
LDSNSVAGAGNVSEEMSDDSEELVPKAMHDLKTGKLHGKAGAHTLYLVKWEHYSNEIDWAWEPQDSFDAHAALADALVTAWRAANKPWPPAPAP